MKNLNKMKIAPDMQYEIGQNKVGYFPEWSVKDDATLWQKVNKLAHSTFDRSKFTVVGSPVITNDGIASGFSSGNSITKTIDISNATTIKIYSRFKAPNSDNKTNYSAVWQLYGGTTYVGLEVVNNQMVVINSGGSAGAGSFNYTDDTWYDTIWEYNLSTGAYKLSYKLISTNEYTTQTGTQTNFTISNTTNIDIGSMARYYYFKGGSIDLKQFSITVDGVEVFSGNKTGIDTIKADDYTQQGSPTISADGVASGFGSSNYIQLPTTIDLSTFDTWAVEVPFIYATNTNGQAFQTIFRGANFPLAFSTESDNKLHCNLSSNNSSWNIATMASNTILVSGNRYVAKIEFNGTRYNLYLDGSIENYKDSTDKVYTNTTWTIGYANSNTNAYWCGSIDLNGVKIYGNGDLVYQPCLKIPYTEGQNYVKIVDKLYRDRVKDLFEQKGYNGYYTIGEDDFTLPSNKWSDIVEHKENGLTVAEQRVDQTLTIRGACEQGVDVNLPMDFFSADSYAVFGVGTTGTNTASKFTPAADGNYIAIGKGKV